MQILGESGFAAKCFANYDGLFAGFLSLRGEARVLLIKISLEAFFGIFRQTAEFDSHPNSWIPGAHGGGGGDTFLVNPKLHSQHSRNWQGHDCLNITAITTDVGGIDPHRRIHTFVTEFQGERYSVTLKFSAIVGCVIRHAGAHLGRQLRQPRALLVGHQLNSYLNLLKASRLHYPDHLAAGFLSFVLNADDVAHLQLMFESANTGAVDADILSVRVLVKGMVIGPHAPHTYTQVQRRARSRP